MRVQCDAATYEFPPEVGGELSTYALILVPEYERVIARATDALATGGRLVVLDFRQPENGLLWLVRLGCLSLNPVACRWIWPRETPGGR